MNVSLTRKIHIMALPHGTFLKACWSADQSATAPCRPSGSGAVAPAMFPVFVSADCVIYLDPFQVYNSRPNRISQTSKR
jgi:hypothetical protein